MKLVSLAAAFLLSLVSPSLAQVGFQTTTAADPGGQPLAVNVWYPSPSQGSPTAIGPYSHTVAKDAPVRTGKLPLIVFSHGSGGSGSNQADTATALAQAGFVVAAVTHTGDNSRDGRFMGSPLQFPERSRHVKSVIDHMTRSWPASASIDASRIGMLGYSAGATTALITLGGEPDLSRFEGHCKAHPEAWDCKFVEMARKQAAAAGAPPGASAAPPKLVWTRDPRVKAAVVAAPALGYAFEGGGLRKVRTPVQLWVGDKDEITPAEWNAEVVRRTLPRAPALRLVKGAGHNAFLQPCPPELAKAARQICTDPPGFDRGAFRRGFNASVVEFFRETLNVR